MSSYILAAEYVADTVALVLYLEKRKSSAIVEQIFDSAENDATVIHIPAMVFAEMLYLSEKNRITATLTNALDLLKNYPNFRQSPINGEIVESAANINDIPELHDRIISASARFLNLELITKDAKIQNLSFVRTIW